MKEIKQKQFNKEIADYNFPASETWSLDSDFIKWLYAHLKMYHEHANKIVDLTFEKFTFREKEYTLEECIFYILERCETYLKYPDIDRPMTLQQDIHDAIDMFNMILFVLWW